MFSENRISDNMHRQSSRTIYNPDTVDCIVNESDSEFEDEKLNQPAKQKRSANDSRRNQTYKHSNGTSNRHSPPIVTHKRPPSPPSISLAPSHSQHYYHVSKKHHQVTRSPSPPPSSSRHHRQKPPPASVRRSRSRSRSSHERRKSSANRSQPSTSKKRPNDSEELTSTPSVKKPTISSKSDKKQNIIDLSIISDEDSSIQSKSRQTDKPTITELPPPSSSSSSITKIQPAPPVPVPQPPLNSSLLDMSSNSQECELSLFAKSNLSMPNISLNQPTPNIPTYDPLQIIDLMTKYKTMLSIPSSNSQVDACSQQIFGLIQKQIQLNKKALECREREMLLYERELTQREKSIPRITTPATDQMEIVAQSTMIEDKSQHQETPLEQSTNTVLPTESVPQSIPITSDASKIDSSEKPTLNRRPHGRTRFSQFPLDLTSIFESKTSPTTNLYAGVDEDEPSSSSINSTINIKNTVLSPILAPSDSTKSIVDHDLKVTSSNSCRKVEIQGDNIHPTVTSKDPPQDLRITLRNNRTKQQSVDESKDVMNQLVTISKESVTTFNPRLIKTISNTDNKQESHDYQQQRSITSTSIDKNIDEFSTKRDDHQQRTHIDRQQHNPREHATSSSSSPSNERSHSQKSSKHESNPKHRTDDDLRSRIDEHKYKKPSRPPPPSHRSNR